MNDRWSFGPYLRATNASAAIDWYVRVLGATLKDRHVMPDGTIGHAELDVHGSLMCIADKAPHSRAMPTSHDDVPITLYAVVPDVDFLYNRAIENGAKVERPLADQPYGHRNGGFIDPYGHVWYVSMPIPASAG